MQSVAFTALPRVLLDCARTAKTITDCSLEVVQSDEPILVVECLCKFSVAILKYS